MSRRAKLRAPSLDEVAAGLPAAVPVPGQLTLVPELEDLRAETAETEELIEDAHHAPQLQLCGDVHRGDACIREVRADGTHKGACYAIVDGVLHAWNLPAVVGVPMRLFE